MLSMHIDFPDNETSTMGAVRQQGGRALQRTARGAAARTAVACALTALVAACGGGGGGSDGSSTAKAAGTSTSWVPGTFLPPASFDAECAAPRTGTDPATQQPYPDVPGSFVDENNWLRSWSNERYLWYDEIVDRDPADYDTDAYFEQMKTFGTTSSGATKDRFHFALATDDWRKESQSGVSAGYGAEFAVISALPPREVVVAYTEPNSPATNGPIELIRGTEILTVDGVDLVNGSGGGSVDVLNAGLFPENVGETHRFTIRREPGGPVEAVTLTSTEVAEDPVPLVDTIDTLTGSVGYLLFNSHIATAEDELIDAIDTLAAANIQDLFLDLRYNGGGYLVLASELAYMIAGPVPTAGRTFELLQFNDKHPSTDPFTGAPIEPLPFVDVSVGLGSTIGVLLPTLGLDRVFVLTGPNTCSASESVINGLRGAGVEVIQIGSTTCGKPYGFYPTDNCGTTYFSINFRGVNEKDFGDYTDGFSPANALSPSSTVLPGCSVADDYDNALGDPQEGRFAAALAYREGGICPSPSGVTFSAAQKSNAEQSAGGESAKSQIRPRDGRLMRPPWREIRIVER